MTFIKPPGAPLNQLPSRRLPLWVQLEMDARQIEQDERLWDAACDAVEREEAHA
jgi:hypothetical protein